MESRTKIQRIANTFDLKLFNLLREADGLASLHPNLAGKWKDAEGHLRGARRTVRTMMHPQDRKETM